MKKLFVILLVFMAIVSIGCTKEQAQEEKNTLTLYAYDSLTAEWGLLPQILDQFEANNNVEMEIVSFADTGSMLNQLILEKNDPQADVVIGLDNVNYNDVVKNNLLVAYKPAGASEIASNLLFDDEFTMTPFDHSYIGFVYDSEQISFDQAISLGDLASAEYKDKIIIEQAGASSPGTQLLLWTQAAFSDEEYDDFWINMADNVLTVTPDWSTAYYSMFMEGEAPIVLSYLTSPAYHIDQEETDQYKAIAVSEGYIKQIEGMGVVKNTANAKMAQKFIDYMLEDEVQNVIPTTQWMFPVLGDQEQWPEAYDEIIIPEQDEVLYIELDELKNNYASWLEDWNSIFNI